MDQDEFSMTRSPDENGVPSSTSCHPAKTVVAPQAAHSPHPKPLSPKLVSFFSKIHRLNKTNQGWYGPKRPPFLSDSSLTHKSKGVLIKIIHGLNQRKEAVHPLSTNPEAFCCPLGKSTMAQEAEPPEAKRGRFLQGIPHCGLPGGLPALSFCLDCLQGLHLLSEKGESGYSHEKACRSLHWELPLV